jgi:hypothetical protein
MKSTMESIEILANSGKVVLAGQDEDVVEIVKLAIEAKRSVSFYLTRGQADAISKWFWTSERIKATGVEALSEEEAERIQAELGLKLDNFHYAPIVCQHCSHKYGALEFMKQGLGRHGHELLQSIFSLKNAVLLQVNRTMLLTCPNCENVLNENEAAPFAGFYFGTGYAACII